MEERRGKHPPFEPKLTEEQSAEIVERYMEGNVTMKELAAEYGVCTKTISRHICSSGVLDRVERRANLRQRLALITLKNASAEAAEQLVDLMDKTNGKNQVYAKLQTLQQLLDRAGVREEKREDKDVRITFADGVGIAPKMPKRSDSE